LFLVYFLFNLPLSPTGSQTDSSSLEHVNGIGQIPDLLGKMQYFRYRHAGQSHLQKKRINLIFHLEIANALYSVENTFFPLKMCSFWNSAIFFFRKKLTISKKYWHENFENCQKGHTCKFC
jgi:hypothetical protein